MTLTNFVSMDYILTFAGMIVIVNLLTQFTKKLFDKIGINQTKWVVAGYSFALCMVAAIWKGKFTTEKEIIEACVTFLVNSVIVWFTAMKAFEAVSDGFGGKNDEK